MANRWNDYPSKKPTKLGWYICKVKREDGKIGFIALFYDDQHDAWVNGSRLSVFQTYEVYKPCKGPDGEDGLERIYKDDKCIRDDVVAWKNMPKS